jgi:hypothetical protein
MRKGTQKAMLIRSRSARQASGIGFELWTIEGKAALELELGCLTQYFIHF